MVKTFNPITFNEVKNKKITKDFVMSLQKDLRNVKKLADRDLKRGDILIRKINSKNITKSQYQKIYMVLRKDARDINTIFKKFN